MTDRMYKKLKYGKTTLLRLFTALLILLSFAVISSKSAGSKVLADDYETREYTEEEKAQAKAWLSAHGYPPTRAGAQMAYQDYLNGKFDNDPEVQRYLGKEVKITDAVNDDASQDEKSVRTAVETHPPVTTSGKIAVTTRAVPEKTTEEMNVSETEAESFLSTGGDAALKGVSPDPMKKSLGIAFIAVGILAGIGIVFFVRR